MDAAMILVLVLTAGVIALLAWFEINSRRNDARKNSASTLSESHLEAFKSSDQTEDESESQKRKVA